MTTAHTSVAHTRLSSAADAAGGAVFVLIIALAAIFCAFLFDLRADKIFHLPQAAAEAGKEDLVALTRAADLALGGEAAAAYDADIFRSNLNEANQGLLWLNPPHALLLVAPLGVVPYALSKTVWIALTVLALLLCVRMTAPRPLLYIAALLSPAAFASLLVMQSGPMIAAALAGALIMCERRPILAGLLLALLTMKPQYGLMAPVFLAAIGAWRAFGAAAIFTVALAALSALIFGADAWRAFFESIAGGATAGHSAALHRDMLTIHQTIGKLGGGEMLRSLGQAIAIAVCAGAVWRAARGWPRGAAIGFALLASAFAAPSLWVYDWPIVAAGLFMLARASSPWPPHLQILAGALWVAPLISLGALTMQSSLAAPSLFAATLVAVWIWGNGLTGARARYSAA